MIPKRAGTETALVGSFFFDNPFSSFRNILGKIKMAIMITRSVSISVIEAKKILIYFIALEQNKQV